MKSVLIGAGHIQFTLCYSHFEINSRFFSLRLYLPPIRFGSLQAAVSQAAVGGGGTAADDLELLLSAVGPVQQLLDELLKTHFGAGFTRSCFLQELVDLGHLPEKKKVNV